MEQSCLECFGDCAVNNLSKCVWFLLFIFENTIFGTNFVGFDGYLFGIILMLGFDLQRKILFTFQP